MEYSRYYRLTLETGEARDDAGASVAWAACPDLPGAYEEAPTADAARAALRDLARRIIAEHLVREDPLDPDIAAAPTPAAERPDLLVVAVGDEDIEEARRAPLLMIEQPEP
jgi:hypothetical protein